MQTPESIVSSGDIGFSEESHLGRRFLRLEPNGKKTRILFHDAKAFERPPGSAPGPKPGPKPGSRDGQLGSGPGRIKELKGTAALKIEKFGEWSGLFIDSEGNHWDFKCSRVQE